MPDSRMIEPAATVLQTDDEVDAALAPSLAVGQVDRLDDVGDDARHVVEHAERHQHQRERAEDPEERPEPGGDRRLEGPALRPG